MLRIHNFNVYTSFGKVLRTGGLMYWGHLFTLGMFLTMGCAHGNILSTSSDKPEWPKDLRMAQAQIPENQGNVTFEQMPNSVIVIYHLENLEPKASYQLVLHRDQNCKNLKNKSTEVLTTFKASKVGVSEHTFKLEDIRVSGGDPSQSLEGGSIVLQSVPAKGAPTPVACSEVEPSTGQMAQQP
jgi:hypothetical protein